MPGKRKKKSTAPAEAVDGSFDSEAAAEALGEEMESAVRFAGDPASAPTPTWYKVIMLGLMIAGLLFLIAYYLFSGAYPIPGIGAWNLAVGLGLMMVGFVMTTRWR